MAQLVDVKGIGVVEFPDEMTPTEIRAALTKAYRPPPKPQAPKGADVLEAVKTFIRPATSGAQAGGQEILEGAKELYPFGRGTEGPVEAASRTLGGVGRILGAPVAAAGQFLASPAESTAAGTYRPQVGQFQVPSLADTLRAIGQGIGMVALGKVQPPRQAPLYGELPPAPPPEPPRAARPYQATAPTEIRGGTFPSPSPVLDPQGRPLMPGDLPAPPTLTELERQRALSKTKLDQPSRPRIREEAPPAAAETERERLRRTYGVQGPVEPPATSTPAPRAGGEPPRLGPVRELPPHVDWAPTTGFELVTDPEAQVVKWRPVPRPPEAPPQRALPPGPRIAGELPPYVDWRISGAPAPPGPPPSGRPTLNRPDIGRVFDIDLEPPGAPPTVFTPRVEVPQPTVEPQPPAPPVTKVQRPGAFQRKREFPTGQPDLTDPDHVYQLVRGRGGLRSSESYKGEFKDILPMFKNGKGSSVEELAETLLGDYPNLMGGDQKAIEEAIIDTLRRYKTLKADKAAGKGPTTTRILEGDMPAWVAEEQPPFASGERVMDQQGRRGTVVGMSADNKHALVELASGERVVIPVNRLGPPDEPPPMAPPPGPTARPAPPAAPASPGAAEAPRFEQTQAGQQGVIGGTPSREMPAQPLKPPTSQRDVTGTELFGQERTARERAAEEAQGSLVGRDVRDPQREAIQAWLVDQLGSGPAMMLARAKRIEDLGAATIRKLKDLGIDPRDAWDVSRAEVPSGASIQRLLARVFPKAALRPPE